MRLFDGESAAHSLGNVEHTPIVFRIKDRKDNIKILKYSHGPLNYTPYPIQFH
jgi:hypothetical protein